MTSEGQEPRFDVAITFAGENRAIAAAIRAGLVERDLRVYYDEDFKVEMWGKNLVEFLHTVYSTEAAYALMLISRPYVDKHWTAHERRAAQERALVETREYILPVKLEDVDVPGMPSTTFYLDARIEGVAGIVDAVVQKVGPRDHETTREVRHYDGRVPTTPEDFSNLLALQPRGWEHLLFAGRLREELASHSEEYLDFQLKYTPRLGHQPATRGEAAEFLSAASNKFLHTVSQLSLLLNGDAQAEAFGAPGVPGDVGRISHIASRISAIDASLMETAAELRAARMPGKNLTEAAGALADFAIQPVEAIREFSKNFSDSVADLPARLEAGEQVTIEMSLVLELPEEVSARFNRALDSARLAGEH